MVRSPAGTPITPGASPAATPSMLTAATTPAVSICSWPGSFASTRRSRSAPARGTPSAGGTSISSSSSPPSPGDTTASAPAGAMVTLPARCSTESRSSVREASLTRTCASPTLSTSSRRRSRSASSARPLKRTDAPAAGSTSQTPLLRRIESAAPAGTPGTTTSDPAPPIVSVSPSTRSPAGSRTRTCPHAAGCIDTPLFMRGSDGLGAGDAHRLGRLSRADGDVATHVAVAVARADHGVTPGLELDVTPGEGAEGADARYRNLGEAVGEQREVHRLVEFRQQRAEARDLAAQHRTR